MFCFAITYRKKVTSLHTRIKCLRTKSKRAASSANRPKRRKILQDPTFIFNTTNTVIDTQTSWTGRMSENVNLTKCKSQRESLSKVNSLGISMSFPPGGRNAIVPRYQGCSEQFRSGVNIKVMDSLSIDDTTPEELAAYFDQLLHIPKPMSQMAEMMYT